RCLRQQAVLHPRRDPAAGGARRPPVRHRRRRRCRRHGDRSHRMSESRILVLDGDMERAERIATLLEFMDFTPRVAEPGDVDLSRAKPSDWVAVVVGDVDGDAAWPAFAEWLGGQPLHPPLMVLPGHDDAPWRKALHPENLWPLDYPVRRSQLQEALRRASLKRINEDEQREHST